MPYKNPKDDQAYKKRVRKVYTVTISKVSQQDMIDYLELHKPVNAFLKRLIRESMNK